MIGRVQVVFIFKQDVDGKARRRRLELIVQDEIGVEEVGKEMPHRCGRLREVHPRCVGHAVGREYATNRSRDVQTHATARRIGAALSFTRHWNRSSARGRRRGSWIPEQAGSRGPDGE